MQRSEPAAETLWALAPARGRLAAAGPGVVTFAIVAGLCAANGGYDAPSWGWGAALLATVALTGLLVRQRVTVSRAEAVTLAAFGGLTLCMLASTAWSSDPAAGVLAAERGLVYVAGLAALAFTARRGSAAAILAGALAAAAATVMNGLLGIILPSTVATHGVAQTGRLAAPIGYWNGLGIIAAVGLLLALGLATRSGSATGRAAALAPMPALAVGLYLTFSRGGWLALGAGLAVLFAVDPRRWRLAAVTAACLPWVAADVLLAARSPALTHIASPIGPSTAQGHRLGLALLATIPGLAVCGLLACAMEGRWTPSRVATWSARTAVAALAAAALIAPVAVYGSPAGVADHLTAAFNASAPGGFKAHPGHAGRSLNARLFSLSGDGRAELWRAAWSDARAHPALGSGAGTYEAWWLAHRPGTLKVRNAHSTYLETLAELGPMGLVLLLMAVGAPLLAAVRNRRAPLAPVAGAAFASFCLHAAVDWDFQLTGVTLLALACAAAAMAEARPAGARALRPGIRWAAAGAAVAVAVIALAGMRGNLALARSADASAARAWPAAASEARTAHTWQPWSDQPWLALGEADLGWGHFRAAASDFRHAVRRTPDDWQGWFGLARATTGRERARALAHARALNPHEPVVVVMSRADGAPG
jgi:O-antigen ligase/polysaccharide polymerase Wzy-like membrane protein